MAAFTLPITFLLRNRLFPQLFYENKEDGLLLAKVPDMDAVVDRSSGIAQRIADNLSSAVCLLDGGLRLRYINPAGEALFGVSAKRLLGIPAEDLLSSPRLAALLTGALEEGQPFTERECRMSVSGEQGITVDLAVIPLREPPELLLEMHRVDHQLRIAREENLIAQQQATREVVRGLAHEIKNPLGGLRGAAQLLESELGDSPLREYTGVIIHEADRLQNLLNRMLGPNTLPHKRRINIHQVLERVRTLVQAEAPAGVHLLWDYDPSLPELHADLDQLIQVVLNIVRNAVQALPGEGEIILRSRALRRYTVGHLCHKLVLCIDIIDNGPGIPEQMQQKIFYPLVTGRAEGTGLGLSIAQSLVNQHGGVIECRSRPGRTRFSIFLPVSEPEEETG